MSVAVLLNLLTYSYCCACNPEYISGGTLKARVMDKKVELSWDVRFKMAHDIACGMVCDVYQLTVVSLAANRQHRDCCESVVTNFTDWMID